MKNMLYIFLVSLLICSCRQWDEDLAGPREGQLEKIEDATGQVISKFEYKRNGLLESMWTHNGFYRAGSRFECEYYYDDEGELVKAVGFEPGNMIMSSLRGAMDHEFTIIYEYDQEGRLESKTTSFDYLEFDHVNYSLTTLYEYLDSGVVEIKSYADEQDLNGQHSFTKLWMDEDNNIVKKDHFVSYEGDSIRIFSRDEFTYDEHPKPFINDPEPNSSNNVTTKTVSSFNYENGARSVTHTSDYKYDYTYNNDGYPKKRTETWPNGIEKVENYFYKN